MKKIYVILLLSFTLAFLVLVTFFLTRTSQAITFLLLANQTTIKQGETLSSSVFLQGSESQLKNASVVDVKIDYDKSKLEIVTATPGPFFKDPMIVKWDEENGLFSMAINPTGEKKVILNSQKQGEIVKLVFLAKGEAVNTKVSFGKTTSIYIFKRGSAGTKFIPAYINVTQW